MRDRWYYSSINVFLAIFAMYLIFTALIIFCLG